LLLLLLLMMMTDASLLQVLLLMLLLQTVGPAFSIDPLLVLTQVFDQHAAVQRSHEERWLLPGAALNPQSQLL